MSTHGIPIVQIETIEPHPNKEVERLEIVKIWGWQCCVLKGQFKIGDKAVWIAPDYKTPLSHPSFAFLDTKDGKTFARIKVRKLKGSISQGLLINVPPEFADKPVGTDLMAELGIERYEPPFDSELQTGGQNESAPSGLWYPKFDVESYQRYAKDVFIEGEEVLVHEKTHGSNSSYVFARHPDDNQFRMFVKSRTRYYKLDQDTSFNRILKENPSIELFCRANPETIIWGEIFGQVQKGFDYGCKKGEIKFAAFAAMKNGKYLDYDVWKAECDKRGVPTVPLLYRGPYSDTIVKQYQEGQTTYAGATHTREGVVITPVKERIDNSIGRVVLKLVSNVYLEKH